MGARRDGGSGCPHYLSLSSVLAYESPAATVLDLNCALSAGLLTATCGECGRQPRANTALSLETDAGWSRSSLAHFAAYATRLRAKGGHELLDQFC